MLIFSERQRWTAFGSGEVNSFVSYKSAIYVNRLLNNRAQKYKEGEEL